ncbi:MAG: M48 family metallopeptidase [Betaproteobacteria bacterium]|nr:M48 family metalloprotease [Rhodocyclaceae bacterium]MCA3136200.1 M48 family metalloprotease [Rhodocyclaceae bacterium]MCA3143732.1 M48 family metalloprotease [Rhodocyclaceae bacterium]MCA3147426.1 M48 family metalloprotease [Rhodocyclaceae bacterium]MCE2899204.1 M48 family metallopeptidase [Betaproteobacteria bacterium]
MKPATGLALALAVAVVASACSSDSRKTRQMLDGFGGVGTVFKHIYDLAPVSEKEEIEVGEAVAATLLGARPLVDDPSLQRYVNDVGLWIARHSERPDLPWTFGVIDSEHLNAFATPGGTVLVTRGLMRVLRSESELAGVLGHEIAHAVRRHHISAMRKGAMLDLAATGVAVAAAGSGGGELGEALAQATKELYVRGLDRGDEYEADRLGVLYAARAGYDPYGLPGVIQTLSAAPAGDTYVALLFKTHPAPAERLDRLATAMGDRFETCCGRPGDESRFERVMAAPASVPPAGGQNQ